MNEGRQKIHKEILDDAYRCAELFIKDYNAEDIEMIRTMVKHGYPSYYTAALLDLIDNKRRTA